MKVNPKGAWESSPLEEMFPFIETQVGLSDKIRNIIEYDGPVLCELLMDRDQPNIPKMAPKENEHGELIRTSFEDLYPFLSSDELADNMYKNWEYNRSTK